MIPSLAPEILLVLALILPLGCALLIPCLHRWPNLRETVTLVTAAKLAFVVWSLFPHVLAGARPEAFVWRVVPGLELAFKVEPLGMLFALVAGSLWLVSSIYSIGYMRANGEPRQTTFYVCFAVAIASAMGIAFAKNLFTLFLFYEALTLSTYPLVTHKRTVEAMRAGRIYLLLLLGTSMVLLLPAIIATGVIAGTLDFAPGGILAGKAASGTLGILLALYVFGIGKAALMPFHFWLPAAMVAPAPVSALLHAVAVVKAGVFTVLKVATLVFGIDVIAALPARSWLLLAAALTLMIASLTALAQDNLKARLAYSTVSQLAYVVLGAMLATKTAVTGAGLQIATHAAGKITLFFCAGAIYVATHKTEVSELGGIGRVMPWTMLAFLVGALSIIGIPPLGGSWSKWFLAMGALDAGDRLALAVLMASSLLSVAYLMPIVARAFFAPPAVGEPPASQEAPVPCLIAMGLTAAACLALFFGAGVLEQLIAAALPANDVLGGPQ